MFLKLVFLFVFLLFIFSNLFSHFSKLSFILLRAVMLKVPFIFYFWKTIILNPGYDFHNYFPYFFFMSL